MDSKNSDEIAVDSQASVEVFAGPGYDSGLGGEEKNVVPGIA